MLPEVAYWADHIRVTAAVVAVRLPDGRVGNGMIVALMVFPSMTDEGEVAARLGCAFAPLVRH
jgi:hypothetical protein